MKVIAGTMLSTFPWGPSIFFEAVGRESKGKPPPPSLPPGKPWQGPEYTEPPFTEVKWGKCTFRVFLED